MAKTQSANGPGDMARRVAVESGAPRVRLTRLWLGLLLAPGIWVVGELAGYYFAARSCELGHAGVPFRGTAHPAVTHIVLETIIALVAALGLFVAVRNWRETQHESRPGDAPAPSRAHFMAFSGLMVSALFLFGIVLFWFSGFVVNPCSQAR
jgi:hypothetical protein